MKRNANRQCYQVEALEPRLLLSADGVAAGADLFDEAQPFLEYPTAELIEVANVENERLEESAAAFSEGGAGLFAEAEELDWNGREPLVSGFEGILE